MLICAISNNQPWNSTNQTLIHIPNCKTQFDINQIHARLLSTGFIKNPYLTNKMILNFVSSPHKPLIEFAQHLFFTQSSTRISKRKQDPFLWNAVIKSFSHGDNPKQAVVVFGLMVQNRVCIDKFSVSLVLKACSIIGSVKEGVQVHGFLKKIGFLGDLYLQNCLVSMYVKCGCVEFARQVFDRMPSRDSVSFNSMIDGYVKSGKVSLARDLFNLIPKEMKNLRSWNCMISGYLTIEDGFSMAWELFDKMPERDLVSWNLMIRCCVKTRKIDLAHLLFDRMPKRDVISWANLINGYAKLGNIEIARKLFDEMPEKDVISCNMMMAGYVQNGVCSKALELFRNMISNGNPASDDTTLSIALSAIAQLGLREEGIAIHNYIDENRLKLNGKLGVSLINMYAKTGTIETAMRVFKGIKKKNLDHWNAMIGGLAIHGFGKQAFYMFLDMQKLKLKPDTITFVNVLNACAHSGLLKEGVICFEIMKRVHKVEPEVQHFGCLVDMFARAGQIENAINIIEKMPVEPNNVVLRTLLSACNNPNDIEGIKMDYCASSTYVLLSNIYARFGMWDRVRKVREMMKDRELKKVAGRSWIELDGSFHEFFVGDGNHPQVAEIYSVLDNRSPVVARVKSFRLYSETEVGLFPVGIQI